MSLFPVDVFVLLAISALLFIGVTLLCRRKGLFKSAGGCDPMPLLVVLAYAGLWVLPSLLAWAVWATWFR